MKNMLVIPLALGTLLSLGAPLLAANQEAREKTIALSSVPQPALDAARRALGSDPTVAKIVTGTRPQQYELQAKNDSDQRMSVHVRADGTVIKKETES
jgi:hypothetical protein